MLSVSVYRTRPTHAANGVTIRVHGGPRGLMLARVPPRGDPRTRPRPATGGGPGRWSRGSIPSGARRPSARPGADGPDADRGHPQTVPASISTGPGPLAAA